MRKPVLVSVAMATALLAGVAACNRNEGGNAADSGAADAVRQTEQEMLQDIKAKDAAKVISYYAPDAAVMFPGDKPTEGNAAIARRYDAMIADQSFSLDFTNAKTSASGDLAYTRGTYRATFTAPGSELPITESGNYVTIFRKQSDGSWKIVEDISAPGLPEAAAVAAAP